MSTSRERQPAQVGPGQAAALHQAPRRSIDALSLVHLDVPLAVLLPLLELVLPDDALLLRDAVEHLQDARHHALRGGGRGGVRERVGEGEGEGE